MSSDDDRTALKAEIARIASTIAGPAFLAVASHTASQLASRFPGCGMSHPEIVDELVRVTIMGKESR